MKIRSGFVSNSSSSSFVLITPKDYDYTKHINFNPKFKDVYKDSFRPTEDKCLGQDILVYTGYSDYGENSVTYSRELSKFVEENGHTDDETYELADEIYNDFFKLFDKDKCFIHWDER